MSKTRTTGAKAILIWMGWRYVIIPDPMTAAAMMQAGEADVWLDVISIQNVLELEKKGFKTNWGPGMFWALLPNSADPKSPFSDKASGKHGICSGSSGSSPT